jgi:sugar phosphate isomerase/epimerase
LIASGYGMGYPEKITDLSRLCIHTQTNRPWDLERCVVEYHRAGIRGISVWRHLLEKIGPNRARSILAEQDMTVVSLVRGGFFASKDKPHRREAIGENLRAIDEAVQIDAPLLILVCGADPRQSPDHSREQIREGILEILPVAGKAGIRLAVEPLHPMYAADRSAIVTLGQANDMVESIGSPVVGVAVDLFHLWWDPQLHREIERCGGMNKIYAFHISDWKPAMTDILNDRGIMGEGCIDIRQIRGWVESAGFEGYHEVEIFSEHYWAMDQAEYLEAIKKAYLSRT